ncbi:aspartyl glutamyl-tRNA amidotransferase subunit b-related protein [Botryosphaeria dothidea]|uniref:Altered inheritance of mitochondria protein 41 n=1 Tax=Botryosphaeria dothidea TaxID=55169 RepID=A0A8H4IU61_9PEZI|nr:aspartyl glutamyl-tRNA amidotransferase subunit b-related protein [Botryosphaeria dothidea]
MSFSLSARLRPARLCLRCMREFVRPSSTASSPSPILSRLRDDMKTAMRSKDSAKLAVVRSILNDITNASKTAKPISDDVQLRALLLKKINQSKDAAQQFRDARREDLAEKEDSSATVMKTYVGEIEDSMGGLVAVEELQRVVKETVDSWQDGKLVMGKVMEKITGPGGALDGRMVEKGDLAKAVKEALGK